MLHWFDTRNAKAFAQELAAMVLADLKRGQTVGEAKAARKAGKSLARAARRVAEFKAGNRLNFYTRSSLSNTFLWALKDAGCTDEYAQELTEWLTMQL